MWASDWQTRPECLPYILTKTNKFKNSLGKFHIVYDQDTITACGGVHRSSFNKYIALAGVRTWVAEQYRNRLIIGYEVLPLHKQWAKDTGCKQIALTFNEYNKNLIKIWQRQRLGEQTRLPKTSSRMFAENFNQVSNPVIIQKTPQWVIYENLDPDWNFNWDIIKETKP